MYLKRRKIILISYSYELYSYILVILCILMNLFLFVARNTVVIKLDYGVIWNSYVYVFDWVFEWFLLHEF